MKLVRIHYTWRCTGCDAHGEGDKSSAQAERHTKQAGRGHVTYQSGRPA